MLIVHDPDAWVTEIDHRPCDFHERNPLERYAGCTCSTGISQRPATPEERQARRRARLQARRSELQREMDEINREIGPVSSPSVA